MHLAFQMRWHGRRWQQVYYMYYDDTIDPWCPRW